MLYSSCSLDGSNYRSSCVGSSVLVLLCWSSRAGPHSSSVLVFLVLLCWSSYVGPLVLVLLVLLCWSSYLWCSCVGMESDDSSELLSCNSLHVSHMYSYSFKSYIKLFDLVLHMKHPSELSEKPLVWSIKR